MSNKYLIPSRWSQRYGLTRRAVRPSIDKKSSQAHSLSLSLKSVYACIGFVAGAVKRQQRELLGQSAFRHLEMSGTIHRPHRQSYKALLQNP